MPGKEQSPHSSTSGATPGEPRCNLCDTNLIHRIERQGPLESWIYPLFGYYPWRCNICRTKIYLRKRKRPGDTEKNYSE